MRKFKPIVDFSCKKKICKTVFKLIYLIKFVGY